MAERWIYSWPSHSIPWNLLDALILFFGYFFSSEQPAKCLSDSDGSAELSRGRVHGPHEHRDQPTLKEHGEDEPEQRPWPANTSPSRTRDAQPM